MMPATKDLSPYINADSFNQREDTHKTMSALLDKVALITYTLGTLAFLGSVFRITSEGWLANIIIDMVFFPSILGLMFVRKKLPTGSVMWALIGLLFFNTVCNLLTMGLASVSLAMFITICVLAGVVFGIRAGIWVLCTCIITMVIIGLLIYLGIVSVSSVSPDYLLEPQTWATQVLAFTLFTVAILVIVNSIQGRLSRSLSKLLGLAQTIGESEKKYRLLAENMQDVIVIQDMDMGIKFVSPSAQRMFGYTIQEIYKLKLSDFLTPASLKLAMEQFGKYVSKARQEDVEIPLFEFEYVRKDGSTFWGELRPAFLRDADGNLSGSQSILRDTSARKYAQERNKALEARLRQSEKMEAIGQLAGGIAHDFNNQLASMVLYADLIREEAPHGSNLRTYAHSILKPAQHSADLIQKLLAFARKAEFLDTQVDMHLIINEVADILEAGSGKHIKIVKKLEAASYLVQGDPSLLQNALLNLGLNARDSIAGEGTITFTTSVGHSSRLRVEGAFAQSHSPPIYSSSQALNLQGVDTLQSDSCLVITVRDTGSGIDESVLPHIFEPFFTTKGPDKGTGMGLAAVYGTVHSHHGSIEAANHPDGGAVFTFILPLVQSVTNVASDSGDNVVPGGQGTYPDYR